MELQPMETSMECPLASPPSSLGGKVVVVVQETTAVGIRTGKVRDLFHPRFQTPPSQVLPLNQPLYYHPSPRERHYKPSNLRLYNDRCHREIILQRFNRLHRLHQNSKTHWLHYKEAGTWKEEPRGDTQRTRYQSTLGLVRMASQCYLQLRIRPYQTEVGMSESQ